MKHSNLTITLQLLWPHFNPLKNCWINYWRENLSVSFYLLMNITKHCRTECLRWATKLWKKCVSLTKTFLSFNQNSLLLNVNTELTKRMLWSERKCWVNAQHSKKECVEVVGIYRQVNDKDLETKVLAVFVKFNCPSAPEFMVDYNRPGNNNNRVIHS